MLSQSKFPYISFPKDLKQTPLTVAKSVEDVPAIIRKLLQEKFISFDLEFANHLSHITCMQFSTPNEDIIIHATVPNIRQNIKLLNEIFNNDTIVK
ncbi:unnamed protein product, partial [Didymodactylos carnosus]